MSNALSLLARAQSGPFVWSARFSSSHVTKDGAYFSALPPTQRQARRPEPFVFPSEPNLAASRPDCQFFFCCNLCHGFHNDQAATNTCEIENGSLNLQSLFREESLDGTSLALTDFKKDAALGAQMRQKRPGDATIGTQSVGTAIQRGTGLMPPDLGFQTHQIVRGDIGRIDENHIPGPGKRVHPVAKQKSGSCVQAQMLRVALGDTERFAGDVDAEAFGIGPLRQKGKQETTRTGAEVQHPQRDARRGKPF